MNNITLMILTYGDNTKFSKWDLYAEAEYKVENVLSFAA